VVVLAVLGLVWLHSGWGKSFVRGKLEAKLAASSRGTVTIGALDYTFLFGEIRIGDIEIHDAAGRPAIHVGSIVADVDRRSVLAGSPIVESLAIDDVALDVVQARDGTTNLTGLFVPADGNPPLERVQLLALSVGHTRVAIERADGSRIAIADLTLAGKVDAKPATHEVDASLDKLTGRVTFAAPGQPDRAIDLEIDDVTLGQRVDRVDLAIAQIAAGPLGLAGITGTRRSAMASRETSPRRSSAARSTTQSSRRCSVARR
jgi:hypothetical protein